MTTRRMRAGVAALQEELETWYARYVDEVMDGAKQAVFGRGQIGLVGSDKYPKPFADDVALQSEIDSEDG